MLGFYLEIPPGDRGVLDPPEGILPGDLPGLRASHLEYVRRGRCRPRAFLAMSFFRQKGPLVPKRPRRSWRWCCRMSKCLLLVCTLSWHCLALLSACASPCMGCCDRVLVACACWRPRGLLGLSPQVGFPAAPLSLSPSLFFLPSLPFLVSGLPSFCRYVLHAVASQVCLVQIGLFRGLSVGVQLWAVSVGAWVAPLVCVSLPSWRFSCSGLAPCPSLSTLVSCALSEQGRSFVGWLGLRLLRTFVGHDVWVRIQC